MRCHHSGDGALLSSVPIPRRPPEICLLAAPRSHKWEQQAAAPPLEGHRHTHPRTHAPPTNHHALAPTRTASGCTQHPTQMATMVFRIVAPACKVLVRLPNPSSCLYGSRSQPKSRTALASSSAGRTDRLEASEVTRTKPVLLLGNLLLI